MINFEVTSSSIFLDIHTQALSVRPVHHTLGLRPASLLHTTDKLATFQADQFRKFRRLRTENVQQVREFVV